MYQQIRHDLFQGCDKQVESSGQSLIWYQLRSEISATGSLGPFYANIHGTQWCVFEVRILCVDLIPPSFYFPIIVI